MVLEEIQNDILISLFIIDFWIINFPHRLYTRILASLYFVYKFQGPVLIT